MRLLSHHDLLRCFERLLRRAELPIHRTHGFHPHPRLVFALSLPLGVVGCEEVAELELDDELPADEVCARLRLQAPPGLEILSVRRVPLKTTAQVKALCYRLSLPPERVEAVRHKIDEVVAQAELWVVRAKPMAGDTPLTTPARSASDVPAAARLNIRPFLRELRLTPRDEPGLFALDMDLWLTSAGTAKPVEVLGLLGLTDLLEAGAVIERARLELHDE